MGPRIDPCGTPLIRGVKVEDLELTETENLTDRKKNTLVSYQISQPIFQVNQPYKKVDL